MYEYDEYNPKKKDEYEETEQESIDYSADGMEDEPHVDGESIEMEAEVISGEEYTEKFPVSNFPRRRAFLNRKTFQRPLLRKAQSKQKPLRKKPQKQSRNIQALASENIIMRKR